MIFSSDIKKDQGKSINLEASKTSGSSQIKKKKKRPKPFSNDQLDIFGTTSASSSSTSTNRTTSNSSRSIKSSSVASQKKTKKKKNIDSIPSTLVKNSKTKPTSDSSSTSQQPKQKQQRRTADKSERSNTNRRSRSTQSPTTNNLKQNSKKKKPSVKKHESEKPRLDGGSKSSSSRSKRLSFDGTIIDSSLPTTSNQKSKKSSLAANPELSDETNPQHQSFIKRHHKINNSNFMRSDNAEKADLVKGATEDQIERSLEVPNDEVQSFRDTSSKKRMIWLSVFVFVVIAVAVSVTCALLLGGSDGGSVNFPKLSKAGNSDVVASIPSDICNEGIPKSGYCTPVGSDEVKQGGQLCNLLAKSMINTTVYGDIALINAATCRQSLFASELTAGNIKDAIVAENLVAVGISGFDLSKILTEAATASFGISGNPGAYPYAAGLRYNIEANLAPSERLSNIEARRGLRDDVWEPIDLRKFYTVITTESIANGGMGYTSFGNVINDWKDPLNVETSDAFYNYAMKNAEDPDWSVLPNDEYSTQYFLGVDDEAKLGDVPTLICHALVPGQPESPSCTAADVVNGGEVCNLASWAIYDQNLGIDIVLLKADVCLGDIKDGYLLESKIASAVSDSFPLIIVDLLGSQIVELVESSIASSASGEKGYYPYAAGLRFYVNTKTSPIMNNVQVLTTGGTWVPIVGTNTYTVATTSHLENFPNAKPMSTTIKDNIINYAAEWETIYKPPPSKSSTQSYA